MSFIHTANNLRLLAVGEQWQVSESSKLLADWTAEKALLLGGFRRGASAVFLRGFAFHADMVCNLLPPSDVWDARIAFRIAEELIRREDWRVGVVFGTRAVRAFVGGRFEWGLQYKVGYDKIIIPSPQARSPAWTDSALKERIENQVSIARSSS